MDDIYRHNLEVIAAHAPGHGAGGGVERSETTYEQCWRCGVEAEDVSGERGVFMPDGFRRTPLCARCEAVLMLEAEVWREMM